MNKQQQQDLLSFNNVNTVFDRHLPVVKFDQHPGFERYHQRWLQCVSNIEDIGSQQAQSGSKGITKDKQAKRKRLANAAVAVAQPARAWALENENAEVAEVMAVSVSRILRGTDRTAVDLGQNVYDTASAAPLAAALVPQGVTPPVLKALAEAIKKFDAVASKPRETITRRRSATQRLAREFRLAKKCLTEGTDLLIEQFEEDFPEFVAEYRAARVVVDPATPAKPEEAKDEARSDKPEVSVKPRVA